MPNIASYCRVSSRCQKNNSQKSEIQHWLKRNGFKKTQVDWFKDKVTGQSLKRGAIDKLREPIFNGESKTVDVWRLYRTSRRLKEGFTLIAELCEKGV